MKLKNTSNYCTQKRASKKLVSILIYVGLVLLWIFTASFTGRNLIFWTVFIMALITCFVLHFIPNDRNATLKTFKATLAGYCLFIIMMEVLTKVAFNDNDTVAPFMEGFYGFAVFMIPIGYILWQAKKFVHMFGFGRSKRQMLDDYKDHGNDGGRSF